MGLSDRMHAVTRDRIDRTEIGVLKVVAERRGARPTEIAEQLHVHPSSVTRHVHALQATGRLTARSDPDDGRASIVEITEAGVAELGRVYEDGLDAFADVVSDWAPTDVRTLTAGLSRLLAALDARAGR